MRDFSKARKFMVDCQIRPSDVTRHKVIDAMLRVPREEFVPQELREISYCEKPIKLSEERFLLEPRIIAKMLDLLNIQKDELVLDVGAGYGYSSSLLAHMAEAVVCVEERSFAPEAEKILTELSVDNVIVHEGKLEQGAPQHGPYDALILQNGVEKIPKTLMDQLKVGGRLVVIFINSVMGECCLGIKGEDKIDWVFAFNAHAHCLPGFQKEVEFSL